jgi:hypothetical protein
MAARQWGSLRGSDPGGGRGADPGRGSVGPLAGKGTSNCCQRRPIAGKGPSSRAPREGRREARTIPTLARVAQLAEQGTLNPKVYGSIPYAGTTDLNSIRISQRPVVHPKGPSCLLICLLRHRTLALVGRRWRTVQFAAGGDRESDPRGSDPVTGRVPQLPANPSPEAWPRRPADASPAPPDAR